MVDGGLNLCVLVMIPLPVDSFIDAIRETLFRSRAIVVTAAPGAGKTTRVPPALAAGGRVVLLQPRRVAARAIAARIAVERGWTLGREVGWQVRFDRRFSADTRLLVVTEGTLTARLQTDPLLTDFTTVVLDEFHERSIHADLAIALARQAWRARDDLRIVVMSATLDSSAVAAFLDGCPVIDVPGRLHPIEIAYAPSQSVADAALDLVRATSGQVLCFLPGAAEIGRAIGELQPRAGGDVEIVPLHGSLDSDAQDLALRPADRRRIIVATNIAETSLTVPGVTAVVDAGLHKVARYDAERGIDSLETERITADAADQRAGRAGRVAPGVVRRLWDARDRLRPHREPEIRRIDLAGTVLDVIAWGGDPRTLEWFERPDDASIAAAIALLARLGLVASGGTGGPGESGSAGLANGSRWPGPFGRDGSSRAGPFGMDGSSRPGPVGRDGSSRPGPFGPGDPLRLTPLGEQVMRLPLHPRLARILIAGGGARQMAQACALLSERHLLPPRAATTTSDLLSAIDAWPSMPVHVQRAADEIERLAGPNGLALHRADHGPGPSGPGVRRADCRPRPSEPGVPEDVFRRAILAGYPDRVAQRRAPGSAEVLIATGTGATIVRESGVRDGEFIVALDVHQSTIRNQSAIRNPQSAMTLIRVASRVERDWLEPTSSEIVHRVDRASGRVRAFAVNRYDALALSEQPVPADPDIAARLLAEAWLERGPGDDDARLVRRVAFAGHDVDLARLVHAAAMGARALNDVRIANALPPDVARTLDRDAPESIAVPSGRQVRLDYNADGSVSASVKLQELFGLADTPRVGRSKEPVLLSLLAPNGRPVQVTRDLRSFWDRTYPEVRKELRGRYPKHPWPDDPWHATPTHRTRRR
jgi:ATP-dependent helicase HrpB